MTAQGPRVLGVVLAAGAATRMAGSKVTRPVQGRAMVARVVDAALGSGLDAVVVVVGNEAEEVRELLHDCPVGIVDNPLFADGLSTSVHAAIRSAGEDYDAALFLLADQPFVTSVLIDQVLGAFAAGGRSIVRPDVHGRPGNPVLFAAGLFPELLRETGDRGGRDVMRRHPDEVTLVTVEDRLLFKDIDTLEEYEALT